MRKTRLVLCALVLTIISALCWYFSLLTPTISVNDFNNIVFNSGGGGGGGGGGDKDREFKWLLQQGQRANATILMLARNQDLFEVKHSIRQIEDRFNRHYGYPYVFLNEEPFNDDFIEEITAITSSSCQFGVIPPEQWGFPSFLDAKVIRERIDQQIIHRVYKAGLISYHHMCRYYSGFFFKHPLLSAYKYYWRLEPGVFFHCEFDYDPFLFLQANNKTYGFNIVISELADTIPSLWKTVKGFIEARPDIVTPERLSKGMPFLSRDGGENYSLCHYWSNFEIADLDFFRSPEYLAFFDYLDRAGGFYYERWGDAPVHTIALHLLLPAQQLHFFQDVGYTHPPFTNCPSDPLFSKKCACDPQSSVNLNLKDQDSCSNRFNRLSQNFTIPSYYYTL